MNSIMVVMALIVIAYLVLDISYDVYTTVKKNQDEKKRWQRLFAITKLK